MFLAKKYNHYFKVNIYKLLKRKGKKAQEKENIKKTKKILVKIRQKKITEIKLKAMIGKQHPFINNSY